MYTVDIVVIFPLEEFYESVWLKLKAFRHSWKMLQTRVSHALILCKVTAHDTGTVETEE